VVCDITKLIVGKYQLIVEEGQSTYRSVTPKLHSSFTRSWLALKANVCRFTHTYIWWLKITEN